MARWETQPWNLTVSCLESVPALRDSGRLTGLLRISVSSGARRGLQEPPCSVPRAPAAPQRPCRAPARRPPGRWSAARPEGRALPGLAGRACGPASAYRAEPAAGRGRGVPGAEPRAERERTPAAPPPAAWPAAWPRPRACRPAPGGVVPPPSPRPRPRRPAPGGVAPPPPRRPAPRRAAPPGSRRGRGVRAERAERVAPHARAPAQAGRALGTLRRPRRPVSRARARAPPRSPSAAQSLPRRRGHEALTLQPAPRGRADDEEAAGRPPPGAARGRMAQ